MTPTFVRIAGALGAALLLVLASDAAAQDALGQTPPVETPPVGAQSVESQPAEPPPAAIPVPPPAAIPVPPPAAMPPPPPAYYASSPSSPFARDRPIAADTADALAGGDTSGHVDREYLGGLAAFGLAAVAGVGVGGAMILACDGDFCGLGGLIVGGGLFLTAAIFGVPLGVYLGGRHAGGDGSYGAALLGHVLGIISGFFFIAGVASLDEANAELLGLSMIGGVAIAIGGAVLGYELSCSADGTSRRPRPAPNYGPRAAPTFGLLIGGASIGVVGTF